MKKIILVLANSIKHDPARCIAGRVLSCQESGLNLESWIRPVSRHGEGEVFPAQYVLTDGSIPQPLDIIEVEVESPANDSTQPENWLLPSEIKKWNKIRRVSFKDVSHDLFERPGDLWLQPRVKTDRATKDYINKYPPSQSLYLLSLDNVMLSSENGRRYRISFIYEGTPYNLSVTDPLIDKVVNGQFFKKLNNAMVCVSLAPSFLNTHDGVEYHFKIAATVIPYE